MSKGGIPSTYHALSDRLALPTYAQPKDRAADLAAAVAASVRDASSSRRPSCAAADFVSNDTRLRTNMTFVCISSPGLLLTQSRTSSLGKVADRHHFACRQIVPAAWAMSVIPNSQCSSLHVHFRNMEPLFLIIWVDFSFSFSSILDYSLACRLCSW